LFVKLLGDAMGPLNVNLVHLAWSVDISQFDAHLHGQQSIGFVGPIDAPCIGVIHFDVELGQDFKVAFQIGGQDRLDNQKSNALEFSAVQVHQEIETRIREEQGPGRGRVMVLQHRAVVVQDRLGSEPKIHFQSIQHSLQQHSSQTTLKLN